MACAVTAGTACNARIIGQGSLPTTTTDSSDGSASEANARSSAGRPVVGRANFGLVARRRRQVVEHQDLACPGGQLDRPARWGAPPCRYQHLGHGACGSVISDRDHALHGISVIEASPYLE